jgi:hypothetical protein
MGALSHDWSRGRGYELDETVSPAGAGAVVEV